MSCLERALRPTEGPLAGFDQLCPGLKPEVVRIAKHALSASGLDVRGCQPSYGGIRPDRHERRRLNWAVSSLKHAGASSAASALTQDGETRHWPLTRFFSRP